MSRTPPLKEFEIEGLRSPLKRCPDTNHESFRSLKKFAMGLTCLCG